MTNVVLILGDDMRADLLPYMPFVNGTLRPSGTHLNAMRCEVPACSPSRSAILTGQHSRDPGNLCYVQTNLPNHNDTFPVWIASATASNAFFGKYQNPVYNAVAPGWDYWRHLETDEQAPIGYTIRDQAGAVTTPTVHQLKYLQAELNTYLSTAPEPFVCYFAPTNPHVRTDVIGKNDPWPETCSMFTWVDWQAPHLLSDADTATKPSWLSSQPQLTNLWLAQLQHGVRQQIREVYDMDTVVQSMYNTVAARAGGVLGRTIWIFTTDSGVYYEEQRLGATDPSPYTSGKNQPYDSITRVPTVITGSGIPVGGVNSTPMTLQDITATIMAIYGGTPTITQRGTDIRSFLASPPADRDTLYERKGDGSGPYPDCTGIATNTRKLVKYVGQTTNDTYEMYLLDSDPNEYTNVANNPAYLTERNALEARMNAIP